MNPSSSYSQALDQLRAIERSVIDGDLISASEQARQLMPLLEVTDHDQALSLQAKVEALKASVRSSRRQLANQIVGAQNSRKGCHTYQSIQTRTN